MKLKLVVAAIDASLIAGCVVVPEGPRYHDRGWHHHHGWHDHDRWDRHRW